MHFHSSTQDTLSCPSSFPARARRLAVLSAWAAALALLPASARACACGCGIYEVGTSSMIPTNPGSESYLDVDYQDQNRNWSGDSQAPAADNPDKDIRTTWYTFGYQQLFNRTWGLEVEVPYERRHFVTTGGATGDDIVSLDYSGMGDIRIQGLYMLSEDFSSGVSFGVKLPSGSYTTNDAYGDIDRDTQIGSGSTDLLLGGFNRYGIGSGGDWTGFTQGLLELPVLTQVQYRPGTEADIATGVYYNGLKFGRLHVAPIGQLKLSVRTRDTGANSADPVASGFVRVLAAPGVEFDYHPFKVYTDVELPLYYHFRGDQMAATTLFRLNVSVMY